MIFTQDLQTKYPFATGFFDAALKAGSSEGKNRLAHAFMLCGSDIASQYEMALSIAKHLNSNPKNNPSWIDDNAHPAVITISPIDYTEKKQSVISVNQIRELRKSLSTTSPYHRVIIFCDAKEIQPDIPLTFTPPKLTDNRERDWAPYAMDSKIFAKSPANALLKVLEEPPANVTYFFLTNNKEDMLPTIVSRCQVLPIVSGDFKKANTQIVETFLEDIPPKNESQALLMAQNFLEDSKEHNLENMIDALQESIKDRLVQNINDRNLVNYLTEIIKKIETAKIQLKSFVSPQSVIEHLFLSLI